jgi:hypothetical protein
VEVLAELRVARNVPPVLLGKLLQVRLKYCEQLLHLLQLRARHVPANRLELLRLRLLLLQSADADPTPHRACLSFLRP